MFKFDSSYKSVHALLKADAKTPLESDVLDDDADHLEAQLEALDKEIPVDESEFDHERVEFVRSHRRQFDAVR